MIAETQQQLVVDIARDLLTQVAPQELPLLRPISQQFFQNPDKLRQSRAGREEMLGFGVETVANFWTPEVLVVTTVVVQFLSGIVQQAATDAGANVVGSGVRGLFKRLRGAEPGPAPAPGLTPEQLRQVRALALEKAHQLNVPDAKATLLADALVGSLVGNPQG